MVKKYKKSKADEFLSLLSTDEELKRVLDDVVDESILTAATALGAQRGLRFTRAELEASIANKIGLGEYRLSDDGGAGKCKSDSGCRSPCVYCKSNRFPSLGELGQKFQQR
jgi:hypothetical protein